MTDSILVAAENLLVALLRYFVVLMAVSALLVSFGGVLVAANQHLTPLPDLPWQENAAEIEKAVILETLILVHWAPHEEEARNLLLLLEEDPLPAFDFEVASVVSDKRFDEEASRFISVGFRMKFNDASLASKSFDSFYSDYKELLRSRFSNQMSADKDNLEKYTWALAYHHMQGLNHIAPWFASMEDERKKYWRDFLFGQTLPGTDIPIFLGTFLDVLDDKIQEVGSSYDNEKELASYKRSRATSTLFVAGMAFLTFIGVMLISVLVVIERNTRELKRLADNGR